MSTFGGHHQHHGFKLDMGCVERDEDRSEFLSACSRLDEKTVFKMVDVKGVDASSALDAIGQNCIHFVVCSSAAVAVGNHKDAPAPAVEGAAAASTVDVLDRQTALIQYLVQNGAEINRARKTDGWTPLFLAAAFNMTQMVSLLLQMGAKTSVRDSLERTVDEWVEKYRLKNVKDLLEHSRSRIPQTRFSCVQLQRGPAQKQSPSPPPSGNPAKTTVGIGKQEKCQKKQESAESVSSPTTESSSSSTTSSSSATTEQQIAATAEQPTEPCLLTAQ